MFGAICAGRPVQTNLQQIDQTKFVFQMPNAENINHITVFLLPKTPFPDDFGATVYFSWPGRDFQLLGGLSNAKPSAIFKLQGSELAAGAQGIVASLGISIEPLQTVEAQVNALKSGPSSTMTSGSHGTMTTAPPSPAVLTTRIVSNLYNFLTGYAVSANQISPTEQFVPLRAFQEWHAKFTKRIQVDASFLDRDQE